MYQVAENDIIWQHKLWKLENEQTESPYISA